MPQPEPPGLYRHPTRSEIIDLAAAEGHDADIPSNLGSIHQVPSRTSERRHSLDEKKGEYTTGERDVEKGNGSGSISSADQPDAEEEPERDPNVVDFDGPNDPENPMNWKTSKKWGMVALISAITFLTPLASSQFAPGVPEVMRDFNSTSDLLEGFMVSVYVLGFAFGPLIIAPLSEMYGRLPLYHSCNFLFIVFTIAAAVANNMAQFVVFRFLMGCFGGAPMVLGGGTIADLIPREQRGTAMAVWMMGPTVGPCVGPIIGGFLTVAKGWRWNFWFVAIVGGAFFIMSLILMSETSGIIILQRKVNRLKAETGNTKLRSKLDSGLTPRQLFKFSIIRPAKMLFRSTICFAISLYIAITYAYLYILFTTFTAVFKGQYGWHGGITGLSFLGLGIGSLIGQFTYIHYGNKVVHKHMARGDFRPEHRLKMMCIGGFFIPCGLFIYGWSVQYQTHFMVPIVATGIIGFGLLMTFMPATTYLVDNPGSKHWFRKCSINRSDCALVSYINTPLAPPLTESKSYFTMASSLPESNTSLTYTQPSSEPHLTHTPIPKPGPQEVLVKIKAAAINPVDIQLWGNPMIGWLAGKKEKGIGRDYSGEVVALGEEASKSGKWEVGDEVSGLCNRPMAEGTFTQHLSINPTSEPIAKKPTTLSHHEAAAIPLVVLTAFACLDWLPSPSSSPSPSQRRVIVSGASGGVGMWCVQLAKKLYSCHVTGICSGSNVDFVQSLGADEVIDYRTQDVPNSLLSKRPGGTKYDLYIDCVGGTEMFAHWNELLHPSGAYITIVGDKTSRTAMGGPLTYFTYPSQVMRHVWGYFFGPRYANVILYQKSELLEQVRELAEKGEVKVVVQDVVKGILTEEGCKEGWEQVKGYMVEGRVRGKIVVDVA
ncbi:uncharacterized protein J4E87_004086 [Alternaria ethzedia]|uniref:uncharacterized protein n=1 Tax=Alternaria ethzedia TaxID=181014 RepID=UPI0020C3DDA7|nr:uncharacterized protein J4E87_004086 [Alternaria ethzedia]KAI4627522.1 hypothetical protein J4E87_004086 [Alternaria ethzedia]